MRKFSLTMSTARGVALVRAIETARPAEDRIFADPYARSFIDPLTYYACRDILGSGLPDRLFLGGTVAFAIAREAYVGELMQAQVDAGVEQLVILGAGFDTRAYRLKGAAGLPVFEVDHPITQAAKHKALKGVVDPPADVRFVAVDFETDSLGERLATSGYSESARTLFVWQGVTMYLTAHGVDATLGFVARHAAPGSVVVFDYFHNSALSDGKDAPLRGMLQMLGERLSFGIAEADIVPFLETRGFTGVTNVGGAALKQRYLVGKRASQPMATNAGIVFAQVAERAESAPASG